MCDTHITQAAFTPVHVANTPLPLLATTTEHVVQHKKTHVNPHISALSSRVRSFLEEHMPHSESADDPNSTRLAPIGDSTTRPTKTSTMQKAVTLQTASVPQNLIIDPSFEQVGSHGIPDGWQKGGYGANDRSLYLITGAHAGSYAARVHITQYTSGDAKWRFSPISVEGGETYDFSDWYFASVDTEVDVQVTHNDGSVSYLVLGSPKATTYGAYAKFISTFTLPTDATSITIFHVLYSIGTLTVDDYSLALHQVDTSGDNYVLNGDFETSSGNGLPANWMPGGYGDSTRNFVYPVTGNDGSNAAQVSISNYQSGDAKWTSVLYKLQPGQYQYTDEYKADVQSMLTAQFQRQDGTFFYSDLKTLPQTSGTWKTTQVYFTVPSDAVAVRIFHLIQTNGTLALDNVAIADAAQSEQGIFKTGAVSFRFDDGIEDQYTVAAPILDNAGFEGTFYIVSQQTMDNGFSGYMSIAQVQDLYARGHEIGAHTRTHPHLTTLTKQQEQDEIAGSRQDILTWDVGPVGSFAYPFGEYDATTIGVVEDAGFESAAATISGYATPNSDHYQLEYQEVNNDTTLTQVQQWVDTAAQTHTWLILTFHDVKENGELYSTTPETFQSIVNYVKGEHIPVVTVSAGMESM